MLGDFGEVYVLDWGLARLVDGAERPAGESANRLSRTGELMGTPLYMAPEQMVDPGVGVEADVFALGAILFEVLTLERLRDAQTLYLPAEARPSVRAPERGVAPELETICVRATETDPADRHPSARALQEAVVRYLEGDRELAQRRQLAAEHGRNARAALARADDPSAEHEQARAIAMRELVRALALDPTNDELVGTLARLLETPPRVVPAAVKEEEKAAEQVLVRIGARYSIIASITWFVFLPVVIALGLVPGHEYQAALILAPAGLAAIISAVVWRQPRMSKAMQLAVIALTLLGAASTSRLFGPLILLPTLVATFCIVLQAHPSRRMRYATWALGVVALVGPVLLEVAGVLPASYLFENGTIVIVPQLHELPRTGSLALMLCASLAMMIVPCVFIGRLRAALNVAQRQLLVQHWHFRRLGDQLTGAVTPG
jgi:serine/threonine-protein kinase